VAEVKFCGLTRAEDALAGASLGAAYLGVVFAGGPRRVEARVARAVLDGASAEQASDSPVAQTLVPTAAHAAHAAHRLPRRVGVFGDQTADAIAAAAAVARLDVIQLHGASDDALVAALRARFTGQIWRVVRVRHGSEAALGGASRGVDGVVVDALVPGTMGGTGVAVNWEDLARTLERVERPARLVLAGGLDPDNVERAVGLVAPDVVDVSSGVESEPGIKDHVRMRAFAVAAARGGR
jgi:phosphoribosylanthranilate isomerase